jgi:hypothetical protein
VARALPLSGQTHHFTMFFKAPIYPFSQDAAHVGKGEAVCH